MKTNPTKERLLILCFLTMLRQKMEKDKTEESSKILPELMIKEDLEKILHWLFMNKIPEELGDPETMDKKELLATIGGDIHILSYFIELLESKTDEPVTPCKVYDVLNQLEMQTHYLMNKITADWDEYDYSNYKSLCRKAGLGKAMYGIYDANVSEEDKYAVLPLTGLYDRKQEAEVVLTKMDSKENLKLMKL